MLKKKRSSSRKIRAFPRDNDLDGAAKNSLSFSRNSDGNDCFFTALADNPADRESVGSNSVDRSGSVTAASADDAAEVNFNFGSTKGIIRLAADEEEEEEEQVSDDDPAGRESVGSNETPSDGCPSIHAEMEDLMLAFNAWDLSEVDDEEAPSDGCPSIHAEMEDLMLAFNAWDLSEVDDEEENEDDEQWEVQEEEAVTADDAAEVNFNFGSTEGIIQPAAEEEEEEEEQVSDDDPDRESVGSNTTPPDGWPSIQGEEALTAASADDAADDPTENVDEEEDGEGENFAENNDDLGAHPASRAAVQSLISMQIRQEDFEPQLCVICQYPLSVGEFVIPLPCRHRFHAGCILYWLERRNSCPSCRYELPTEDPAYEEDPLMKSRGDGAFLRT